MLDLWPCTDDQRQHLERLLGLRPALDADSGATAAADVRPALGLGVLFKEKESETEEYA